MVESATNNVSVERAVELCLKKNLYFAAYRLPNKSEAEIVIQTSGRLKTVSTEDSFLDLKGFLVAPFIKTQRCPSFIISPDIYASGELSSQEYSVIEQQENVPITSTDVDRPEQISPEIYKTQIESVIEEIKKGIFEKVVLSRVKLLSGDYVSILNKIFSKLVAEYPNTFVFLFNAGSHLWIGATPEPLIKAKNGTMYTVSLAGTRPYSENNLNIGAWNSKERLEQEYVTRYISEVLSRFNLTDVNLRGPYTKKAGNLIHLRTDFSFKSNGLAGRFGEFLYNLHPTPAVCGMPLNESLKLILNLEKHKREYYAGFLGPVGLNDKLSLFVNLRCMKVLANSLALFVGGGITADSVPEDEWLETEIKTETLLSIIRQFKQ